MNSQAMMGVAIVLLAGAGAVGYWGLTLSREAAPAATVSALDDARHEEPAVAAERPTTEVADLRAEVVVLARDIPAFSTLTEADLAVERLRIAPPGSYSDIAALIGRKVWRDLPAGTLLSDGSFSEGGPLARMIRPGERAVAVKVDEVVSAGGHVRPGDYVDVLLYLKGSGDARQPSAQVAVPAIRVLSVGRELGLDLFGQPAAGALDTDEQQHSRSQTARSVVLAVPEALVTRFTLAAQAGALRLVVRSAQEQRLASFYAGEDGVVEEVNRQLFLFENFLSGSGSGSRSVSPRQKPGGITVYRGSTMSRETP